MIRTSTTWLARLADRLARHPLAAGVVVLAAVAFLVYVAVVSVNGLPFESRYRFSALIRPEAPPLKRGDEIRMAGQVVGLVQDVEARADGKLVELELPSDLAPIGRDARVRVKLKSLSGLIYVEVLPGNVGDPLPANATLPSSQSEHGVTLQDAIETFDVEARRHQARALTVNGFGLAGRGEDLNAMLYDLPDLLRAGAPVLRAFSPRPGELSGLMAESDRVARGFAGRRPDDAGAVIRGARQTFEAFASRRAELGATLDRLRPFEDEALATLPLADPLLEETTRMAGTLAPALADLDTALPAVNRLLRRGGELRDQSRRLAGPADPLLRTGRSFVAELYPAAASLAPFAGELAPLSSYLARYDEEIETSLPQLAETLSHFTEEGGTAPNNPAWRFDAVYTCHNPRDPYPEPGEALTNRRACP